MKRQSNKFRDDKLEAVLFGSVQSMASGVPSMRSSQTHIKVKLKEKNLNKIKTDKRGGNAIFDQKKISELHEFLIRS